MAFYFQNDIAMLCRKGIFVTVIEIDAINSRASKPVAHILNSIMQMVVPIRRNAIYFKLHICKH